MTAEDSNKATQCRALGGWEGKVNLPSDAEWAKMDEEIAQLFEESKIFPREDDLWHGV